MRDPDQLVDRLGLPESGPIGTNDSGSSRNAIFGIEDMGSSSVPPEGEVRLDRID